MGNITKPDGTLEFNDSATPYEDFSDSHEYAKRFAMFRDGTRYERENLPVEHHRNGMWWFETDTWATWRLINHEWRQTQSFQSRFRGTPMNITKDLSRMDWDGAGASFGVPDFSYSGGAFTCVLPGVFQLTGQVVVQPAGKRVAFVAHVFKNGDLFFRAPNVAVTEGSVSAIIATAVECRPGDILNVDVYANEAIGVDTSVGSNVLNIARIG